MNVFFVTEDRSKQSLKDECSFFSFLINLDFSLWEVSLLGMNILRDQDNVNSYQLSFHSTINYI